MLDENAGRLIRNPLLRSTLLSGRDLLETVPRELPRHLVPPSLLLQRLVLAGPCGEAAESSLDCKVWVHKLRPCLRNKRPRWILLGIFFPFSAPRLLRWNVVCGLLLQIQASLFSRCSYISLLPQPPLELGGRRQGKEAGADSAWLMAPFRRGGWGMNDPPCSSASSP